MKAVCVVGNPKPASRTRKAAELVAEGLGARESTVLELGELGPALLGRGDPAAAAAVETVQAADVVVVASPTFKATYSGLLKLFLDQFAGGTGMAGVVAVPLMLGAGEAHALAGELHLKPVLAELGASCPTAALFLRDDSFTTDGRLGEWLERWSPTVTALAGQARA
jgi:FMN reductase